MSAIFAGRYTAKTDEPFVVFLIGMRINIMGAGSKCHGTNDAHVIHASREGLFA